jgi:hypothetical protein
MSNTKTATNVDTTKEAKKLVNALTYGKILENTPGERPHHQLLISYQMAVADAATSVLAL